MPSQKRDDETQSSYVIRLIQEEERKRVEAEICDLVTERDMKIITLRSALEMVNELDGAYGIDFTEHQRDQLHDALRLTK